MQLFLSNHNITTLTSSVSFIGIVSICHPLNILFSHLIVVHYRFRVVLSYDASCFLLYVKWCLPRLIDKSFWKFAKLRNIFSEKIMFLMEYIFKYNWWWYKHSNSYLTSVKMSTLQKSLKYFIFEHTCGYSKK